MALDIDKLFNDAADKLLSIGADVLQAKLLGVKNTKSASNTAPTTTTSALEGKLPWILGGAAVIGIGIILWKR